MPDFTAINNLRLKSLYASEEKFSQVQSDVDFLTELFEVENQGLVFVWDDKSKEHSTYVSDTKGIGSNRILKVINKNHVDTFLWHIDGVMFKRGTKCDCALLNNSILCFVEFKSEAKNNSAAQASFEYEKAEAQVETILTDLLSRCASAGFDITKLITIKGMAVFNRTVPRYNASQKAAVRKFEKAFNNKFKFEFENEIEV